MASARPRTAVVALDVGGTAIKAATVAADGSWIAREREPTPGAGAGAVADAAAALVARLRARGHADVRAVGLLVPGIVHVDTGTAVWSANLGWRDVPIGRMLEERCGLPVVLSHDVRAAAVAEHRHGAARGIRDVLYVSVGTGIGAASIVDGTLREDAYAGELGHLDVGHGERCACGARGCLEAIAAASAIARRYAAASGHAVAGAEQVLAAAPADPRAAAVWDEATEALGKALATAARVLAPERVVLGGGLSLAGEALRAPVAVALRRHLTFQPMPELALAALRDEAGCLGAALLALDAAGERPATV